MPTGFIGPDGKDLEETYLTTTDPNWIDEGLLSSDNFYLVDGRKIDKKFMFSNKGPYKHVRGGGNYRTGYYTNDNYGIGKAELGNYLLKAEDRPTFNNNYIFNSDVIINKNSYPFNQSKYFNVLLIGGGGGGGEGGFRRGGGEGGGGATVLLLVVDFTVFHEGTLGVGRRGAGGSGGGDWGNPSYLAVKSGTGYIKHVEAGGGQGGGGGRDRDGAGGIGTGFGITYPKISNGIGQYPQAISISTTEYLYSFNWTNAPGYGIGGDGGGTPYRDGHNGKSGVVIIYW